MTTPGSKLQTAVIKKLQAEGVFCWRQNNQATYDPKLNGGRGGYRSHVGLKGVPDIIAIINGLFVGIEAKAGNDRMSPDQILFKKRSERHGAKYFVVKSVKDVDDILLLKA